jgi:YggT family protein
MGLRAASLPQAPVLLALVNIVSLIVLISVILSWFPGARDNPMARGFLGMTDPVFDKIRQVVPPVGGLDLSPMIVILGLQMLKAVLR